MCCCMVSHKWQYICVMFMYFFIFFLHVSHRSLQQRAHPQEFPHSQYKHPSMATQPRQPSDRLHLSCAPREIWHNCGPNLELYWPISDLTQCTVLSVQLKARMPSIAYWLCSITGCYSGPFKERTESCLALGEAEREVVVFSNIFWWGSEDDLER